MDITIKAVPTPEDTWLQHLLPVDYADSFMAEWDSGSRFSSEEMLIAVFCRNPVWLRALYAVRNLLVKLLCITATTEVSGDGRRKGEQSAQKLADAVREGGTCGIFNVPFKSDAEIILCGRDRHLDFYLSIQTDSFGANKQRMVATTLVRYNNAAGRLYFFFVRPFHCLIVPMMMKGAIRTLEERKKQTEPSAAG